MALNAKEVVRVFACSSQLSYNLTRLKYSFIANPVKRALCNMKSETDAFKGTLRALKKSVVPIEIELESIVEVQKTKAENDLVNDMFNILHKPIFQDKYRQISHAVMSCMQVFSLSYDICFNLVPMDAGILCWPLMLPNACNIHRYLGPICNFQDELDPGLGEGYVYLKKASKTFTENLINVNVVCREIPDKTDDQFHTTKLTAEQLVEAFEVKYYVMQGAVVIVNVCLALLFLRLVTSAQSYHDLYLTSIDYDNVYITGYFKRIDGRRKEKHKCSLLPLKKV
ncbi:unnamed protein product [Leptosia nina]|uniref:Dendritic cell-specific transmembrane protein-like domain-containing protein n=1 Tax=Leptosia nina TaxID=320188 RepID=A0AAV1JMM5_9NEOP